MAVPLLSTKFYIPPARAEGVTRPRLTAKLMEAVNRPGSFSLLSGPAGFGKTTLLSEFASDLPQPAAWLALDEGDNDPIRFWSYLIAACQTVQPEVGETALALFRAGQPLPDEAIPTLLINDFASSGQNLVLILDDFHTIQNPAIHAAFTFLLEHLPGNLHPVLASRVDPPWPLARFRARNRLIELRTQDLRFTTEEAAAFLNQTTGLKLSAEDVAALERRTEGWIAGLQLAALSMQGRSDIAGFIQAFTGSHVYVAEYLVEEVLSRQPEAVQNFLLETSILERLSGGLCEAVSGSSDGQAKLRALQRANLFVLPLDDEGRWFRYHHLFADLLQARLRQTHTADDIARLHRRAAIWYEQAGMAAEAIEHALAAKDYAQAVQLLEKVALPVILQAHVRTVEGWLQALPDEHIERSPRLTMAYAWMNLLRGTFMQAEPYLERLEGLFTAPEAAELDPALQGEWMAIQSKLLNVQGKPAESRDVARRALQILPEGQTPVRSMVLVNLAAAYGQMLDYKHAIETFQLIVREAQTAGDYVSETLGTSAQGQMALAQGRLRLAFEIVSEGIRRLEAAGRKIPFSATLYGEMGQIYFHWHQLDLARSYSRHSLETSGRSGYSDPEIYHHIMRSRMYQMEGDWEAAAEEMRAASELGRVIPPTLVREEVVAQQARVDLATGRLAAAQTALEAEGFHFEGEFSFPELPPGGIVVHESALLYNSALRILLARHKKSPDPGSLGRGLALAGRVLAGELESQQLPSALETLLLRAQMHAAQGEAEASLADAARALELAEPEGFISIFAEAGTPAKEMLRTLLERKQIGTVQEAYVRQILAAFPQEQATQNVPEAPGGRARRSPAAEEALVEPLTARELEVLGLIAAGDSNQAIAEKLVITVSAVKKHSANIYGKLNVSSRTQAVARARQLGLLAE